MANLALSAKHQIQNEVDKNLEPKLDELLARKVKPNAMQNTKSHKKEAKCQIQAQFPLSQQDKEAI